MKWFFVLLILPMTAFAQLGVFRDKTELPRELHERVYQKALECGDIARHWSLQEKTTLVRKDRIDQGIIDYYYTTNFNVQHYFDGTHPITKTIVVKSAQWEINNPPDARWGVESVECPEL